MLRSLHRVDAAFRLGPAAPATGTLILAFGRSARARHTPNRQESGRNQRMTRQFGTGEDRFEFLARNIGEGIELQPCTVVLDYWNAGARAALEALAAVEPRIERLQRPRQRLDLANTAAGVGIGEPEVAVGILARQRLLGGLDRADVRQAQRRDQRVAKGQRLLEQPAGVEE